MCLLLQISSCLLANLHNDAIFEFHPTVYFVKDPITKSILLRGTLKDGLYQFPVANSSSSHNAAHLGERVST